MKIKQKTHSNNITRYRWDEAEVKLSDRDSDIRLILPSGRTVLIQFRIEEGECVDICLDGGSWSATNWIGDSMEPAPADGASKHTRKVNQIMLIPPLEN